MSQFYRVAFDTTGTPVPINLAGAKQIVLQSVTNTCQISNTRDFQDYFTLYPTAVGSSEAFNGRLVIPATDPVLYMKAGGAGFLEIWLVS